MGYYCIYVGDYPNNMFLSRELVADSCPQIFECSKGKNDISETDALMFFHSPVIFFINESLKQSFPIAHFIVVCSVNWPLSESEDRVGFVLIQTFLLFR